MANKQNRIRPSMYRLPSVAERAQKLLARHAAEQVSRRRAMRALLESRQLSYRRMRTGSKQAEPQPPAETTATDRTSQPTSDE